MDRTGQAEGRQSVTETHRDAGRAEARGGYDHLAPLFLELRELQEDDPRRSALRERLVTEHLPVAENIARRYRNRGVAHQDLAQVAVVGLMNAVDRFDPSRGSDFMSFAVPTMVGEVRRHFRDSSWLVHVPRPLKERHASIAAAATDLTNELGRAPTPKELAARLGIPRQDVIESLLVAGAQRGSSLDEPTRDDGSSSIADRLGGEDNELLNAENREALRPLLAALPERERTVIVLRFFHTMTQSEIAKQLGISQMHVSRLLARTLAQLRRALVEDA
jgi:RNA polymerase sigma-B factor